ncbi:MAG TPA: hypothetical protein VE981_13790 [Planctomycetota bacterium]|nr:hypothetical protein [Planctomycetota bacterium]
MSRAFMKEGEQPEPRCPSCGTLGDAVGPATLAAHVAPELRAPLGDKAYYCVNSACATAYFNGWGTTVGVARMSGPSYPKDPDAPLCPCFGVGVEEIVDEARAGKKDRIRSLKERAEGPEARCSERSPDGRCCLPRALQLFRENFVQ